MTTMKRKYHPRKKEIVQREWISATETASMLGCSVATVYLLIRRGKLRATRITGSRDIRIRPEWVDEWMATHVSGTPLTTPLQPPVAVNE